MEKAWEVSFTCGMIGCEKDSFIDDLPSLTDAELLYIMNDIKYCYEQMIEEHRKRYPDGEA